MSSSPDPLAATTAPSLSHKKRMALNTPAARARADSRSNPRSSQGPSPSKHPSRRPQSTMKTHIQSPTKFTTTSNSMLSPWRIKVVVEAERDDDDGDSEYEYDEAETIEQQPFGRATTIIKVPVRGLNSSSPVRHRPKRIGGTTTVMIPIKGLSSSPVVDTMPKQKSKLKRVPTPRPKKVEATTGEGAQYAQSRTKKIVTDQTEEEEGVEELDDGDIDNTREIFDQTALIQKAEKPAARRNATKAVSLASSAPKDAATFTMTRTRRATPTPLTPTLASTRTRRAGSALPSPIKPILVASKKTERSSSPNQRSKRSPSTQNLIKQQDDFVMSEGVSFSLPYFPTSPMPDSDAIEEMTAEDAESDAQPSAQLSEDGSQSPPKNRDKLSDFTYMPDSVSYTPPEKERRSLPEADMSPLFGGQSLGPHTFYGIELGDDEGQHEPHGSAAPMLPEELVTQPVAHVPKQNGALSFIQPSKRKKMSSDTPKPNTYRLRSSSAEAFPEQPSPLLPSNSKKKGRNGKGKAIEESHTSKNAAGIAESTILVVNDRKGEDNQESIFPSSPPFRVVIMSPPQKVSVDETATDTNKTRKMISSNAAARNRDSKTTPSKTKSSKTTPLMSRKRSHDAEVPPDAPAATRRRVDTPSLTRVRDASEVMSDILEVDDVMKIAGEGNRFGNGFTGNDGPPTPESSSRPSPQSGERQKNLPPQTGPTTRAGDTGILSPPRSQLPDSNNPLSPGEVAGPKSDDAAEDEAVQTGSIRAKASASDAITVENTSPASSKSSRNSYTDMEKSAERISKTRRQRNGGDDKNGERTTGGLAAWEDEWEKERHENIRRAQEVGAITIADSSKIGERTKLLFEDLERERSMVRRQAKEVGAITINDEDTLDAENIDAMLPAASEESPTVNRSPSHNAKKTNTTRRRREYAHISANRSKAIPGPSSSPAVLPRWASDAGADELFTLMPPLVSTLSAPLSANLVWKREHYAHLSALLSSSSTAKEPLKGLCEIVLDRPERILSSDVVAKLDLDKDGFLRLDDIECRAVERFLRREKAQGRLWQKLEVLRRMAGIKIAEIRRTVRKGKEKA